MTFPIQLKLSFTSSDELLLECSYDSERVIAYAPFPKEMGDLVTELRGGKAIKSALSKAQHLITDTLFQGAVGEQLVSILRSVQRSENGSKLLESAAPTAVIALSLPDELHAWPWELATYPGTDRPLFMNAIEMLRVIDALPSRQEMTEMTLLKNGRVITKASEVFKFSAMRAATSHISRNFSVNVSPTHQRSELLGISSSNTRRLFNHLYAVDKYGYLTLDTVPGESALTLSDSPIASESVFLNITPPIPSSEILATRRAGSMVVLSRQFEQSVKTRAESDRAIYHALGAGFSFVHALHWARLALQQSEPESYQWATLTLTTGLIEEESIVLAPFPPSFVAQAQESPEPQPKALIPSEEGSELSDQAVLLSSKRQTPPRPASTFVRETVALIQKSQQSGDPRDKEQLALRTPMMRQLSSIVQNRKISPNTALARSAQLSQQLIEAGYIEDEPLRLPNQWFGRAQRLASALGLKVDPIAQATRALVSSPVIWITGLDAHTRSLFARGLCEEVFQAFPYEPLAQNPSEKIEETLKKLLELSWSDDEEGTLDRRRQMMIGFHSESRSWRRYRRAFGVINHANLLSPECRDDAITSLRSHSLTSQEEATRLPEEGRLILLSQDQPPLNDRRGEVVISLNVDPEQLKHIWHRDLRAYLTAQAQEPSSIEERLNSPITTAFTSLLCLALRLDVITPSQGFDALLYSVLTSADMSMCTESAELYLYPCLIGRELAQDCLKAFAQRDQDGYEASWLALCPDRSAPELPVVSIDI